MAKRLLLGSHNIICHITPPIISHSPKKINSNFPIVLERLRRLDEIVLLMHETMFDTKLEQNITLMLIHRPCYKEEASRFDHWSNYYFHNGGYTSSHEQIA
ncbi:unnamed protein product [Lactuca virosa]|uniref:Uncharacterized protein n=1 Tax=Lactuca virosa TaxID=75947 RepID=A0AAU9PJR2_9ASTR|nr:unnamed protein product [Lactuca virosa]